MSGLRFCFGQLCDFFSKKVAEKFAHFKKKQYLCIRFPLQVTRTTIIHYIYGNIHYQT